MFINDNGDIKEIGVKAFDTLPVGAEIDYNGTEVPDGWEEIENKNPLEWKLVGSASGVNSVSFPSDWNEILIKCRDNNRTILVNTIITRTSYDPNNDGGIIGGWHNGSSDYGFTLLMISYNKAYLAEFKVNGVDKKSTSTTYVYYR